MTGEALDDSDSDERGLRLLSIDGGGIRGLSPLFMLKQILYRIQHAEQLSDLPRPCDVFDLAGGTGTGGLIVMMLFRLQMSVDEAIHAFTTLTENIFSPKNWTLGSYEDIDKMPRLYESMVNIINQKSNEDPMQINIVNEDGPKCFVSALLSGHAEGPTFFRSWSNADQDHSTIVQAAWATTRAPLLFNVVEHNNPVKYVVEEANTLFPGRPISCVLSLGTGTAGAIGLEHPDAFQNVLPQTLIGLLKDIAEECERQSNAIETQLHQEDEPDFYFRLNVDESYQNVSLAEWDVLNEVSAHTLRYLEKPDVEQKIDQLVQILKGEPEPTSHPAKEDIDLVPYTLPEPSSIAIPLHRLPATLTEDDNTVPSATPEPSSIVVQLNRSPVTSTSEVDAVVPSAVPEPLSITVPLSRLPATSISEGDDFVPSAVPEPSSITLPLYRLPETPTSAGGEDDFVPSGVPEPLSIVVPPHRLPATAEEGDLFSSPTAPSVPLIWSDGDDFVPSVAPEPSSITVSLFRPVSTSLEEDDLVPSAAPDPPSIVVPLCRFVTPSLEDDKLVPSAGPEPSSITTPLYRSPDIKSVEGDDFVPSFIPEPLSAMVPLTRFPESVSVEDDDHVPSTEVSTTVEPAISTSTAGDDEKTSYGLQETTLGAVKISPPTELSTSQDETYFTFWKRFSPNAYRESPEGSASSICLDGTRKEEIEAIMRWIEAGETKKPLFVVLGQIGTGKTTLLNTISQKSKADGYYAAGYFFSGTDHARNTPERLINTVAYQITEAIPELRPYVVRIIESEPSILDRSIESQTQRLLLEPLRQLKADYPGFSVRPHVIIIDALDECSELNDQIRVITALAEVLKQEHVPFLCLLSCRLNLPVAHEISTTLAALIHDEVILGKDGETEQADIWAFLRASFTRIRDTHVFKTHIPEGWPAESDLETIVRRSSGRFIYPATIVKYLESPSHRPHEQLRTILKVSITKSEVDPLVGLDALYQTVMSSVKNLTDAIEILGFHLVRSSPQFWIPKTVEYTGTFNFENHFRSLDADVVLAPLSMASVLESVGGYIRFYHMSFAQFLLDPTRSGEYFVDPKMWQHKVVSQLVQAFYAREQVLPEDIEYLIREVKAGTELHKVVSDSFKRVVVVDQRKRLPFGGIFNIWPFVTSGLFDQLQFAIPIDKIATVFIQRGEDTLPLPILIKLAATCHLSNPFLLIELCRTCAGLLKKGFIQESLRLREKGPGVGSEDDRPHFTSPNRLLLFMSYLADYLDDQHRSGKKVLLPKDYLSASLRCLWYLQSSHSDIHSSLRRQLRSLADLPETFGIYDHLNETSSSSSITLGALDALPALLPQTPPSSELLATLQQPFDSAVISRMPSSSRNALGVIHDYLVKHDPEYPQQSEHTVMAGLGEAGEDDEPPVDFEVFLHRRGSKVPEWVINE